MRAPMSMMWFVLLGAFGFGVGGAICAYWFPVGVLPGWAFGDVELDRLVRRKAGQVPTWLKAAEEYLSLPPETRATLTGNRL